MPKKFIVLAMTLMILAGCGAAGESGSGPESAMSAPDLSESTEQAAPVRIIPQPETESAAEADSAQTEVPEIGLYSSSLEPESTEPEPEATELPDLQVIQLMRDSRTVVNDDQVEILCENRCYTNFFSQNTALQDWVDQVFSKNQEVYDAKSKNLRKYAEETIRDFGADLFYSYSNYQDQGVLRHDGRVVSLITLSHVYSGGAHPNAVQTAENLDLLHNRVLRLEDVIEESGTERLESMVQESVQERFDALGVEALYEDYPNTISVSMQYGEMTPYWYFSHEGLVIFYNQYELGPYAAGIIKVELPYQRLSGILKGEFFPDMSQDNAGDLVVRDNAEGFRRIDLVLDPDGAELVIGAEEPVHGVQISEIFWLDDTPVTQQMLISISELTDQDVLVITGGIDDPGRSFAVEFSDGTGNRITYYMHPDGLKLKKN